MKAIISVSDKRNLTYIGRSLADLGIQLVSTGGTARALAADGIPVQEVSTLTRFPEMLGGRLKTLHPTVFGGILAQRNTVDMRAIAEQKIDPIDIVIVNLYPFEKAAANPDTAFCDLVEEIDIGGPSLLRAAAKNFRDVLVVCDPGDYSDVIKQLDRHRPYLGTLDFRFGLMKKAFTHTARYDSAIACTMARVRLEEGHFCRQ